MFASTLSLIHTHTHCVRAGLTGVKSYGNLFVEISGQRKRLSTKRKSEQLKSQHGQSKNRYPVAVCSLYLHFVHIFFALENISLEHQTDEHIQKNQKRNSMMRVSEWVKKESQEIKMTLSKAEWMLCSVRTLSHRKVPSFFPYPYDVQSFFSSFAFASHRF